MGAATFTETGQEVIGNRRVVKGTITMSSSYATGGDSLDLATEVGLKQVHKMLLEASDVTLGAWTLLGYSAVLAGTASAPLIATYTGPITETANGTNMTGVTFNVWLFGV